MTKQCSRCHLDRDVSEFSKKARSKDGLASRCKLCMRDIQWLLKYGLTAERYYELLEEQKGVCAICKGPEPRYEHFPVDHDHTTGKVRGLLCSNCNPLLGYAKDDKVILLAAIDYLEKKE